MAQPHFLDTVDKELLEWNTCHVAVGKENIGRIFLIGKRDDPAELIFHVIRCLQKAKVKLQNMIANV